MRQGDRQTGGLISITRPLLLQVTIDMSGDEELMKWKAEKEAQRAVSASRFGNVVWCGVCACVRLCLCVNMHAHIYKYTHVHSYMCTFVHTHEYIYT